MKWILHYNFFMKQRPAVCVTELIQSCCKTSKLMAAELSYKMHCHQLNAWYITLLLCNTGLNMKNKIKKNGHINEIVDGTGRKLLNLILLVRMHIMKLLSCTVEKETVGFFFFFSDTNLKGLFHYCERFLNVRFLQIHVFCSTHWPLGEMNEILER